MTREEAIEHLRTIGEYYSMDHSDPNEEYEILTKDELDAIYLAIKALEHPEKNVVAVVPCGDAISRQAVFEAMQKNHRNGGRDIDGDFIEGNYSEHLYEDIKSLPSVIPQPKMGEE